MSDVQVELKECKIILEIRKPIIQYDKSKVIQLTFKELNQLDSIIKTPYCQVDLKEDKIEELKESFNNNQHFFASRCLLTVVKIKIGQEIEYYLVDGQHRKNMICDIIKDKPDEFLLLAIIEVSSQKEYIKLFDEINKDSDRYKYKHLSIFEKEIIANIKELLTNDYISLVPRKSSITGKIYSINEFTDRLLSDEIINKLCPNFTPEEIVEFLKQKEKIFFEKFKYLSKMIGEFEELFSVKEKDIIRKKIGCMFMKRNNFLQWLLNETITVEHHFNKRPPISPELRAAVWEKYFKSKSDENCPVIYCKERIYRNDSNSWESGHIKSHFNGGPTNLDNLKPICKKCNNKMKETNWNDYEIELKKNYLINTDFEDEDEIKCNGNSQCKNIINKDNFYIVQRKKMRAGCEDCFSKYNK